MSIGSNPDCELMDIAQHNRKGWNRQAREGCRWSTPVSSREIADARGGRPRIILTPDTPVPAEWLGELQDREVLCLASGGGQQAPLLAAAGAKVTSFDLSEEQLALDQQVAEREGLQLRTVRGDMRDLSEFGDGDFDLIIHVTSNVFCPEILPVWRECHRVLRPGGELLAGIMNPAFFLFDHEALDRGEPPVAAYSLPFSDSESLPKERYDKLVADGELLEFSHSLDEQIGGQIAAGFHIVGFFEDTWEDAKQINYLFPTMINTRARRVS
ncbi:MAG: class I SAM-dependent methyltransferase [Verrucomicrobiota bacterium]